MTQNALTVLPSSEILPDSASRLRHYWREIITAIEEGIPLPIVLRIFRIEDDGSEEFRSTIDELLTYASRVQLGRLAQCLRVIEEEASKNWRAAAYLLKLYSEPVEVKDQSQRRAAFIVMDGL